MDPVTVLLKRLDGRSGRHRFKTESNYEWAGGRQVVFPLHCVGTGVLSGYPTIQQLTGFAALKSMHLQYITAWVAVPY